MKNSIYPYKIKSAQGEEIDFSEFLGKVILVVNTASKCGFTPQFKDLEKLYREYKDRGLIIIGTPSNDFANQEPGTSASAEEFCRINYGVTFPITEKIHVRKGELQHELFRFLTDKNLNGKINRAPLWNFQKYLIDRNGHVANYFMSITKPSSARLKREIEKLL